MLGGPCAGFSGAQLSNLVNEAALAAARGGAPRVGLRLLEEARDKILMGAERKSLVQSLAARRLTAYHESGHALVALNTRGALLFGLTPSIRPEASLPSP